MGNASRVLIHVLSASLFHFNMHLRAILILAFLCSSIDAALNFVSSTKDLNSTIWDRVVGTKTDRFNKRCAKMHKRISNDRKTIPVDTVIAAMEQYATKQHDVKDQVKEFDKNKDGQVDKDEFCTSIENALKSHSLQSLKQVNVTSEVKGQLVKKYICKRPLRRFFKSECPKEQDQTGSKEMALNKRSMSPRTYNLLLGSLNLVLAVLMLVFGIIAAVTVPMSGPLGIGLSVLYFVLAAISGLYGVRQLSEGIKLGKISNA